MRRKNIHLVFGIVVLLIALLACVLPGQAQPGMDSNDISTAIAGTAQAAVEQTAAAQLFTPTSEARTGTSIETVEAGATRYTDYDAGVEITFPAGWLIVRPNSEEFNVALSGAGLGAVNTMLHDQMMADQAGYETDVDRLYVYILRPDLKPNVTFGFAKVKWDADDSRMLDNANMGDLIRGLESQSTLPGFHADAAQITEETGVRIMEIGGRWTLTEGQPQPIPFYSMLYFFKPTQSSTVRVTITMFAEYQDQLLMDVRSIRDSIEIIAP